MKFNTNDLGYKLFSGQLKGNRKNSEQLNKFVAGLFDSDGWVGLGKNTSDYLTLNCSIQQSEPNDPEGHLLYALCDYYQLGTVVETDRSIQSWSRSYTWRMGKKHTKMFFNRIGKHLFTKRQHFVNCIDVTDYWNDISKETLSILIKESRRTSSSFAHKKHISPAYLAGLIAGDGHVHTDIGRRRYCNKRNKFYLMNQLHITIKLHSDDKDVLLKIQSDFGGKIYTENDGKYTIWRLYLGKQYFKLYGKVIPDLIKFMLHIGKYNRLLQIKEFHKTAGTD